MCPYNRLNRTMHKYKEHLKILFIFSLCLIPRLLLLSKGPFHYDVAEYLISMRDKVVTFHTASFPLVSFLIVVLAYLRDALAPRISYLAILSVSTALAAALASVVIYLTFRNIVNKNAALIYALLVSFVPPFFSVTTYGRMDHALAILFIPISVYCFLKERWIICALATSLLIGSRPEGIIILGIYTLFIFLNNLNKKGIPPDKKWYPAARELFLLLTFSLVPVFIIALITPNGKNFFTIVEKGVLRDPAYQNTETFAGLKLARMRVGLSTLFRIAALPALFAAFGVLKKVFEKDLRTILFFAVSFLIFFAFLVDMDVFSSRYLIFPVFFMMFFTSYGISAIRKIKMVQAVVTAFMILIMFTSVFFIIRSRHLNDYQVDFAKYVESITEPNSVIITQDEWVFLNYYTKRAVLIPPVGVSSKEWNAFFEKVLAALMTGHPVYLTAMGLTYDPAFALRSFIQNNFYLKDVGAQINEDWYGKEIDQHLFCEQVFMMIPNVLANKLKQVSGARYDNRRNN